MQKALFNCLTIENLINEDNINNYVQRPNYVNRDNTLPKQTRCAFCIREDDHKTMIYCLKCLRAMCTNHVAKVCLQCSTNLP